MDVGTIIQLKYIPYPISQGTLEFFKDQICGSWHAVDYSISIECGNGKTTSAPQTYVPRGSPLMKVYGESPGSYFPFVLAMRP
jgi:hypothetical protein